MIKNSDMDKSVKDFSNLWQVEDSMENLEFIVRERNRAYYELETGDSGHIHFNF